ncbi:hypothetical protein [Spongiactinospora sp. 9N601]|uniref:hypothetical protein n=1 Tax=Spongiactinospora sp. 9N601 TaxID=3375149 RepID=UPI0037AAFBD8
MEPDDARTALLEVERRGREVLAGSRWPITLLTVWGVVTVVVEPAFALMSERPWSLAFPMAVMLGFVAWVSVFAVRQRVVARGFARRYLTTVAAWAVLHTGYIVLITGAGVRDPAIVVAAGLVVALPLFAGACAEGRRL